MMMKELQQLYWRRRNTGLAQTNPPLLIYRSRSIYSRSRAEPQVRKYRWVDIWQSQFSKKLLSQLTHSRYKKKRAAPGREVTSVAIIDRLRFNSFNQERDDQFNSFNQERDNPRNMGPPGICHKFISRNAINAQGMERTHKLCLDHKRRGRSRDQWPNLQEVDGQFSLKPISYLYESMIRLVSKHFDSDNIPIKGEQVEKLILVNFLILMAK